MPQNASRRRGGYLLAAVTLVVLIAAHQLHVPWPGLVVIALLGLGGALALVRGVPRPAT